MLPLPSGYLQPYRRLSDDRKLRSMSTRDGEQRHGSRRVRILRDVQTREDCTPSGNANLCVMSPVSLRAEFDCMCALPFMGHPVRGEGCVLADVPGRTAPIVFTRRMRTLWGREVRRHKRGR